MKEKPQVKGMLLRFLAETKTAGYALKALLTDGGREFNNHKVQNILQNAGLNHKTFIPYIPD